MTASYSRHAGNLYIDLIRNPENLRVNYAARHFAEAFVHVEQVCAEQVRALHITRSTQTRSDVPVFHQR
jgi:hypothetical protein